MADEFGDIVPFWEQQGNDDTKWRLITNTIEKAITLGVTLTETALQLRLHDFTFGNDRFNQIFRERREFRVSFHYPTTLDIDELPDINQLATRSTGGRGRYQYVVEYANYDPLTDTMWTERTSYFDDNLLTRQELYDIIDDEDFEDTSPKPYQIAGSTQLFGMYRSR